MIYGNELTVRDALGIFTDRLTMTHFWIFGWVICGEHWGFRL